MTKHIERSRLGRLGAAMTFLAVSFGAVIATGGTASAVVGAHQITICHATASGDNPYTAPSPNKWQIVAPNGHGHDSGDIIPPFPAGAHGGHSWDAYAGLNWTAENQAIHARGCAAEAPASGTVTLDKVTTGDGQPAGTTPMDFSVACTGEAVVPDTTPTVTPDAAATPVASGLAVGDTCTIDESAEARAGAASTSFSVNGGSAQPGPVVVELTSADQVIAVVVTNTYACPTGQVADGSGGCAVDVCPDDAGLQTDASACPDDVCPDLEGGQTTTAECSDVGGEVVNPTPTPTPEPAAPAPAVGGAAVGGAQLPRTGSGTTALALAGTGLLLLGAGALVASRRPAATI